MRGQLIDRRDRFFCMTSRDAGLHPLQISVPPKILGHRSGLRRKVRTHLIQLLHLLVEMTRAFQKFGQSGPIGHRDLAIASLVRIANLGAVKRGCRFPPAWQLRGFFEERHGALDAI